MFIIRYIAKTILRFAFGMLSFFLLLLVIALGLCLLAVGLACGMFAFWAVIHLSIYVTLHDKQAEHNAIQAILMASGCFAVVVVFWSIVGDLWRKLTAPANAPSLRLDRGPDYGGAAGQFPRSAAP